MENIRPLHPGVVVVVVVVSWKVEFEFKASVFASMPACFTANTRRKVTWWGQYNILVCFLLLSLSFGWCGDINQGLPWSMWSRALAKVSILANHVTPLWGKNTPSDLFIWKGCANWSTGNRFSPPFGGLIWNRKHSSKSRSFPQQRRLRLSGLSAHNLCAGCHLNRWKASFF